MSRIVPLEPPYSPDADEVLRAMMPRRAAVEPLRLFRTLATHPRLAAAMTAVGRFVLGREPTLSLRERELLIDRTCARCGCAYEWGVHVAVFGPASCLSPEELTATAAAHPESGIRAPRDLLLVRLVDELHDTGTVSDDLWARLAARWTPTSLLEMLLVVGWYHAISYIANGARVEREPWAPDFPAGDGR